MEPANLKVIKDSQNVAPVAIEALSPIPMKGLALGSIQVPKGRHLDVDEILKRSLPRVSQRTVLSRTNQGPPK